MLYGGGAYGRDPDVWEMAVVKTTNQWSSWTRTALRDSGYVYSLAIDPNNTDVLYAGGYYVSDYSTHVGLFKSTDGSGSWTNIGWDISNRYIDGYVYTLTVDPLHTGKIYAGGYFRDQWSYDYLYLFKSTDGGSHWTDISGSIDGTTVSLMIDPMSPDTIYAGTSGGVFVTTNGGLSWKSMYEGLEIGGEPISSITTLAMDPLRTNRIYAGTNGGGVFGQCLPALVYPGDADNSGAVDSSDILPIGLYWRETGFAREGISTQWTFCQCELWSVSEATYADCDGNGLIDGRDVLPIGQNWGMTHEPTGVSHQIQLNDPVLYTPKAQEAFRELYEIITAGPENRATESILNLLHNVIGCEANLLPGEFRLEQNYPNPFNPSTTIRYQIPGVSGPVQTTLNIYNVLGQRVRTLVNEGKEPGSYSVVWDGRNGAGQEVCSGLYYYMFRAGDYSNIKRMLIVK